MTNVVVAILPQPQYCVIAESSTTYIAYGFLDTAILLFFFVYIVSLLLAHAESAANKKEILETFIGAHTSFFTNPCNTFYTWYRSTIPSCHGTR